MKIEEQLKLIESGAVEIIPREELVDKLKKGKLLKVKWGADPSAPDLHLGHTVVIRKLKTFQDLGHKVMFIIGDFTGMIGDPSGKSETRKPLTKQEILKNAETYKKQIFKILDPKKTKIVYNSQWLGKMGLEDIMKLASRYTVARMLERADFKERFKKEIDISVLEFMYPLLQGYDSVETEADIEIGGTDQKFNLLVGRAIQRAYGKEEQVIMTMPLLEGTDGVQKMSKSSGNYIGITDPPSEIYGKVMSIPDTLMIKYYQLLTDLHPKEIASLEEDLKKGTLHPKDAKKELARILATVFHSATQAEAAEQEFESVFKEGKLPQEIPLEEISKKELDKEQKIWVAKLLVKAKLVSSTSEARRLIQQGAVKINEEKVTDDQLKVKLDAEKILSIGKRKFARVKCK